MTTPNQPLQTQTPKQQNENTPTDKKIWGINTWHSLHRIDNQSRYECNKTHPNQGWKQQLNTEQAKEIVNNYENGIYPDRGLDICKACFRPNWYNNKPNHNEPMAHRISTWLTKAITEQ